MCAPRISILLEQDLSWAFNPWRDRRGWQHPLVPLLLLLGVAAVAGYVFTTPNWWPAMLSWGLLALMVLLGMTASLFLPVRYRLDDKGVTVHFLGAPSFRPWEHYRNYYVHDTGVHLTTMPEPSALDPFRGHLLLYGNNRDAVVAKVKAHIRREETVAATTAVEPPQADENG